MLPHCRETINKNMKNKNCRDGTLYRYVYSYIREYPTWYAHALFHNEAISLILLHYATFLYNVKDQL